MIDELDDQGITDHLDIHTGLPERADLAFVFGTRRHDPAYMAYDLLQRGIVERVALTGGDNRQTGTNEAQAHAKLLMELGVSHELS